MPGTERRYSTSSEDASVPLSKQDGTELIPTRTVKTTAPKPAANPLQFIKVGPCDLYKAAQEQIKKVEEIKKVEKTVKDESEDWQSNLDNWKCSRRKRQEHIIDRVVEVKKLELEEHERNRRRGKTLTEMMEERTQKGIGPRKSSLLSYPADDPDDLTDLGITTNSVNTSYEDSGFIPDHFESDTENNKIDANDNKTECSNKNETNGHDNSNSPDLEEYTYERAIQGYKTYAEKNVKAISRQRVSPPKKETGSRIGEKLNELEQVRLRSNSVTDVNLPKVDIHKRRSLFEVVASAETMSPSAERVARDLGSTKIVKERLSSLERNAEPAIKSLSRPQDEVAVTIKDRLSSLEKQKRETSPPTRISNGDVAHVLSINDRLSSLEKHQQGLKEISNCGSSSDEDFGQKLLLSPTMSDREVSSPIVSVSDDGVLVLENNTVVDDRSTNGEILVEGSNQGCAGDGGEITTEQLGNISDNRVPGELDGTEVPGAVDLGAFKDSIELSETLTTDPEGSGDSSNDNHDSIVAPKSRKCEDVHNEIVEAASNAMGSEGTKNVITTVTEVSESCKIDSELETVTTVEEATTVVSDPSGPILIDKTLTETIFDKGNETLHLKETPSRLPLKVSVTKTRRSVLKKPQIRVRKLTPIITAPHVQILSPVKSPGDLAIISEDTPLTAPNKEDLNAIDEDESEAPLPAPRLAIKTSASLKGAETSESGIDMEESSLYTDENIDEVLAEDDVDDNECPSISADEHTLINLEEDGDDLEHVTRFNKERSTTELVTMSQTANDRLEFFEDQRRQAAVNRLDEFIDHDVDAKQVSTTTDVLKMDKCVKSENDLIQSDSTRENSQPIVDDIQCFEEENPKEVPSVSSAVVNGKLDSGCDVPVLYENIIIDNEIPQIGLPGEIMSFPLSSTSCAEPPKEKPPPPPVDLSDEEAPELPPKKTSLRRLDSTKRIKKEIRKKRSDFLGIEGSNDDSYLNPEVNVAPPPDMITFLQEERRLDQQLYRQSFASEADSTEGIDRGNPVDRLDKSLYLDQGLYRQSICSETDSNHETAESRDSGVELDRGHADDLCWAKQSVSPDEMSNPHSRQNSEPFGNASVTSEEDEIMKKEREIIEELEKEEKWRYGKTLSTSQQNDIGEKLTVKLRELEKEKLQLEWERAEEEGRRMADEERLQAKEVHLRQQENTANINKIATDSQENLRSERERLEKEQLELARAQQQLLAHKRRSEPPRQGPMSTSLRYSMPDLQGDVRTPAPANHSPSAWSRVPSADNLLAPQQQQMSRTTLQALAAAPRSRIVAGEAWMQPKRKQDAPKTSYNYQHWLIQEAEHRRITEQQQRVNQSRRSLPNQAKRSPTHSNPTAPGRPHSGHFPLVHYPPPAAIPYSPPAGSPYAAQSGGSPYSTPPQVNHMRATSNPGQSPPQLIANHSHSHSVGVPSHHTVGLPPSPHIPHSHPNQNKPLPDSVIQTLTQRVQNKASPRRKLDERPPPGKQPHIEPAPLTGDQERMLSVSGKKKCSHCTEELGRGAAMVIESLRLFYHIDCFKCCVCHTQLGDGLMGTDVRVRNNKLHCHNCYSSDDGVKFSCV